jgi:hypothetical protein
VTARACAAAISSSQFEPVPRSIRPLEAVLLVLERKALGPDNVVPGLREAC